MRHRFLGLSFLTLLLAASVPAIAHHQAATQIVSAAIAAPMPEPSSAQTKQTKPVQVKAGRFQSGEHPTQGTARVVNRNGKFVIEFSSGFKTDRGPDLVVALHRSANVLRSTNPPAYPLKKGDYVVLAPLRRVAGAQSYAIPSNINPAAYRSVVIWCRQFNATFGAAPLSN
jgi:hypothetical protein